MMAECTELARQVSECTRCDLCKTRKNAVPGEGSPDADVMFVGEAPGRSEDENGRPFVGAAGKNLSAALTESGMSRNEVYITNVVKCRPPGNRIPSSSEKEACNDHLQAEISTINPRIICIMGNTAFGSVLGGSEITKHRGKIIRRGARLYFVTVHPAAAIYRHELLGVLKSDIKRLSHAITELKSGREIPVDIEHPS